MVRALPARGIIICFSLHFNYYQNTHFRYYLGGGLPPRMGQDPENHCPSPTTSKREVNDNWKRAHLTGNPSLHVVDSCWFW